MVHDDEPSWRPICIMSVTIMHHDLSSGCRWLIVVHRDDSSWCIIMAHHCVINEQNTLYSLQCKSYNYPQAEQCYSKWWSAVFLLACQGQNCTLSIVLEGPWTFTAWDKPNLHTSMVLGSMVSDRMGTNGTRDAGRQIDQLERKCSLLVGVSMKEVHGYLFHGESHANPQADGNCTYELCSYQLGPTWAFTTTDRHSTERSQ